MLFCCHVCTEGNGLDGTLPSEICLLNGLENLVLSNNILQGNLPNCISELQTIVKLDLSDNQLKGNLNNLFVDSSSAMSALIQLNLDNNRFSGQVPKQLALLPNLSEMTLHGNDLSGNIDTCGMERSTADCAEVRCDCCTECF